MGLDKTKTILTRKDFSVEPFKADNDVLALQNHTSLPTTADDVMLDRHQSVYYSVEYALKRLLQNDQFIDAFFSSAKTYISCAVERGLLSSLSTSDDTTIDNRIYNNYLSSHITEYHSGTQPPYLLSAVDKCYLGTSAENFDVEGAKTHFLSSSYDSSTSATAISNDIVIEVEYDDSPNVRRAANYVNVSIANKKTGWEFRQNIIEPTLMLNALPNLTQCTYIYRRWLSGIKELYVHLPTTYTFYNSIDDNDSNYDINKNATWICMKINRRHFQFNHIYQVLINGQSLPMQIHEDGENAHFKGIVLPSILRTMCTSNDEKNNTQIIYDSYQSQYILYFACYGSDEQAIRIFGD